MISSKDDRFLLEQDICVACGACGTDESPLIPCAQCGQCFHNFCGDLARISSTVLKKGWRCLDCTICEVCGKATDESLLLLCDDCDISYHIYCLNPPLEKVPEVGTTTRNTANVGDNNPTARAKLTALHAQHPSLVSHSRRRRFKCLEVEFWLSLRVHN